MSGTGRAQKSEAPDLTNVDYEDVLHLYRGWRKSESALKDKNKELTQLKQRVKQLQDSHTRFRGQIQALESVKELTISLQTQLSTVQQENSQLVHENRELQDLNKQAEQLLQDRSNAEKQQEKAFRDVQIEFAMLRGRYEELSISQKSLEEMTADEQVMRMTAESRLHSSEETTNALREEMRGLRMKLDSQTTRLHQSDQELAHASEQLSSLSREVAGLAKEREALATSEAENGILKGDIKRLLRLLEHYPAARGFLTRWKDSDDLSFVGVPAAATRGGHGHSGDAHNYPALEEGTITQSEVNHLKRLHGEDPFPVFDSFSEESDNWVPREAARLGMNFIASKIPHAPPSLILEFLRGMSKVWQKREERKFLRVQAQYEARLAEMKRKLDHAKYVLVWYGVVWCGAVWCGVGARPDSVRVRFPRPFFYLTLSNSLTLFLTQNSPPVPAVHPTTTTTTTDLTSKRSKSARSNDSSTKPSRLQRRSSRVTLSGKSEFPPTFAQMSTLSTSPMSLTECPPTCADLACSAIAIAIAIAMGGATGVRGA